MGATERTLATIEPFNEAFNRCAVEAGLGLMTDAAVFENPSGGRFEGREAIRAVLTRAFALMSRGQFENEELFAAGDRCVALWTYQFDREEPGRGQVRGVDVFRVRDGLVAEKFSYVKSEDFVRQLGFQIPRT
jgi:ketosteroid isomerase-like protein